MSRALVAVLLIALVSSSSALHSNLLLKKKLGKQQQTLQAELTAGPITVGSKQVARVGPASESLSANAQIAVDAFYRASLAYIPGAMLAMGTSDERGSSAVSLAENTNEPQANKFGKLTVLIPGTGSWGPSAAYITRLAKVSQKVVIVYHNAGMPGSVRPQPMAVNSIQGVSLGSSAVGKVYIVGDPSHRAFLDQDQCADLLIDTYGALYDFKNTLGFDPLTSASTLIGHSQGSFCVVQARERMNAAGLGAAIGHVITLGGGLGPISAGSAEGTKLLFNFLTLANKAAGGSNGAITRYLAFVDKVSKGQEPRIPAWRALVDLGVGSKVGTGRQAYVTAQMKLSSLGLDFVNVGFGSLLSLVMNTNPSASLTDGILPLGLTLAGAKTLQLPIPHDHVFQIDDWRVVDSVAGAL